MLGVHIGTASIPSLAVVIVVAAFACTGLGLVMAGAGLRVREVSVLTNIVFGLLHLLDFDYRPQPADLPDTKLWCIDGSADYGPLATATRGRIDLAKIRVHWPDFLRIVASIHTGAELNMPAARARRGKSSSRSIPLRSR